MLVVKFLISMIAMAHGEGLETKYLRSIAREQSGTGVESSRRNYERARVLRTACLIELREKLIPSSCYEELSFLPLAPNERRQRSSKLDRLCMRAARRLPKSMRIEPALSATCVAEIRQAQAIQDYRNEEYPSEWSEN